jgi:hypothetical protein
MRNISEQLLLPYDDQTQYPKFYARIWKTVWLFLTHPLLAMDRISNITNGDDSLNFLLAIGWPIYAISVTFNYLASRSPILKHYYGNAFNFDKVELWSSIITVIFMPLGIWLGFWIYASILHATLWLWRGLNGLSIRQTARSIGFTSGTLKILSAAIYLVWLVVPYKAFYSAISLSFTILTTIVIGLALAKAHRTSIWRGLCASATPYSLYLVLYVYFSHRTLASVLWH